MDPTRELVDPAQVGTALAVLSAVALVLAGVLSFLGRQRGSTALTRGGMAAGMAVLLFPMWLVYNGIENHFGLDSVAGLVINLVLFVLLGAGVGLLYRRFAPSVTDADQPQRHEGHKEEAG